ncbi:uncharacterized protein LOC124808522 [Hydra vulgaris]|uniref:uncharacterized protein LOC124808522 n=1 Tax=Hydra vulgaris TaxID=6087 RepID=UPI0032EA1711
MTLELDKKVRRYAEILSDSKLLAKLSEGDLVATEAHYHKACLSQLYNRIRSLQKDQPVLKSESNIVYGIVLGEIIEDIYQCYENEAIIPVFQLSELHQLFCNRMKSYDKIFNCENKNRLKEKVLNLVPELEEFKKDREVLLTFKADLGSAISDACYLTNEEEGLVKAATILRKQIFKVLSADNVSTILNRLESELTPNTLKSFVRMVLYGQKVKDANNNSAHTKVVATVSQLMFYNCLKKNVEAKREGKHTRHKAGTIPPFRLYVGLNIHSKTRKKGIVNNLAKFGVSVPQTRVDVIKTTLLNRLCKLYNDNNTVCPPSLIENVFTTAAIDNIDHNPSSSTATKSFHGTSISIFQHAEIDLPVKRYDYDFSEKANNAILELPSYYTTIEPTKDHSMEYPIQTTNFHQFKNFDAFSDSREWFTAVVKVLQNKSEGEGTTHISWTAFNSKTIIDEQKTKNTSILLPIINESINSTSMVRQTFNIVIKVLAKINPTQVPIITADQPVYALGKQVQWHYPKLSGEDKLLMMMGGLHIEMASLSLVGDWLEGSGLCDAITKAGITTSGQAESMLTGRKVKRSRYAAQVSLAGFYSLLTKAF